MLFMEISTNKNSYLPIWLWFSSLKRRYTPFYILHNTCLVVVHASGRCTHSIRNLAWLEKLYTSSLSLVAWLSQPTISRIASFLYRNVTMRFLYWKALIGMECIWACMMNDMKLEWKCQVLVWFKVLTFFKRNAAPAANSLIIQVKNCQGKFNISLYLLLSCYFWLRVREWHQAVHINSGKGKKQSWQDNVPE